MEYIANRLGLIFVKINGPAIGHEVTNVDPASANNSAAREELKKLNLAFEMGNNVSVFLACGEPSPFLIFKKGALAENDYQLLGGQYVLMKGNK